MDPRLTNLLDQLNTRAQTIASEIIALEKKNSFKGRSSALDRDLADEVVKIIKHRIPNPPKGGKQ